MKYPKAILAFPLILSPTNLLAQAVEPATEGADDSQDVQSRDIVVTAQRRDTRLLDVPFSVTALSAQNLTEAGVLNSRDIALVTPGLRFDAVGNSVQPAIRGISSTLSGGQELNIAIYVDGVIQTMAAAAIFELPDVRQIEVLKGPQGTLFGRNATGGAILIHTKAPNLTEPDGKITMSYSSFDTIRSFGHVSVPLVENAVAVSLAGHVEYMSRGFIRDVVRDKVTGGEVAAQLLRAKLRFAPWEGADFVVAGTYNRRDDHALVRNSNWRGNNARALAGLYTGPLGDEPYENSANLDAFSLSTQQSASLRGTIEAGPGTITTTTAYIDNEALVRSDTDLTPQAIGEVYSGFKIKTFNQEVLYSTDRIGPVQAVLGANYFTNDVLLTINANNGIFKDFGRTKTKAWAVFGEADFAIGDRLNVIAGVRYSWERKTTFKATGAGAAFEPTVLPAFAPPKTWTSVDPRFSIIYKVSDDTNVYATYSKGFKSGEYNLSGAGQMTPVDPEHVTAYEAGIKSQLGGLYLDLSGFHYKYDDLQVQAFQTLPNGSFLGILTNAANADIWGAEINAGLRVTDAFRLNFGGTYLDANYTTYPGASFTTPRRETATNTCPVPPSASATQAICTVVGDLSGRRMVRAPEFSGNVTASFQQETTVGKFNASATLFAASEVFFDPSNRVVQPGYALLNASLAWSPLDSGLTARIWANNLTNKPVLQSLVNTTSYDNVTYIAPRAVGFDLSFEF